MAGEELSKNCTETSFREGTLLGQYRLDSFTAFSSTGEIYSGVNLNDQKGCSIHLISPVISESSSDAAARLLNKAQKACFFRHKNFISIIKTLELPEGRFIVTEPVTGSSLRDLAEQERYPGVSAEKIITELFKLLSAAENFPVLQFEFTPDNVFITPEGEVKYLYPGISGHLHLLSGSALSRLPRAGEAVPFIAPEVLLGKSQDNFCASVYSLGILYSCLLRKQDFFENSVLCTGLAGTLRGDFPLPEVHEGAELIRRMTEKDPLRRLRSGKEILRGLEKKKPVKKIFHILLIFAAILLALLLFFVYANFLWNRTAPLPTGPQQQKPALQAKKASPVKKLPEKKSSPVPPAGKAVPEKEKTALPPEPLYAAVRKLSVSSQRTAALSTAQKLSFVRGRLEQLQKELAGNRVDSRLLELHKKRIAFRKRQVSALTNRLELEKRRVLQARDLKLSEVNAGIRRSVEQLLSQKNAHRVLFRSNREKNSKKDEALLHKLSAADVDYSMFFNFPRVPGAAAVRLPGTKKRGTTLALLMLNGCFSDRGSALHILYSAEAPAGIIPAVLWGKLLKDPVIPESHIRYLVRETVCAKKFFSAAEAIRLLSFSPRHAPAVLDEMLLYEGCLRRREKSSLLHYAAGDAPQLVPLLLQGEFPLEHKDSFGRTALFYSSLKGEPQSAKHLLAAGADPNVTDADGKTFSDYRKIGEIAAAFREKRPSKAARIIRSGVAVDSRLANGDTLLIDLCRRGEKALVELLIAKGADVNKKSLRNESPLAAVFLSSPRPRIDIFQLLLNKGARAEGLLSSGRSEANGFMHFLCFRRGKDKDAPRWAEVMLRYRKFKTTPREIFQVCADGSPELFRVLLKYRSDLSGHLFRGLLLQALQRKMSINIVRELLKRRVPMPSSNELSVLLRTSGMEQYLPLFSPSITGRSFASAIRPRFGVPVRNPAVVAALGRAMEQDTCLELEKQLKNLVPSDSIIQGKTLLQYAAIRKKWNHMSKILEYGADPFKVSPQDLRYPVTLTVIHDSPELFLQVCRFRTPGLHIHEQVLDAIFSGNRSLRFLNAYLRRHGNEIKRSPVCYLTEALSKRAPDSLVHGLAGFYSDLSSSKHHSVVSQAVAGNYGPGVIDALIKRGAQIKEGTPVAVKGVFRVLTPLECASKVKASRPVIQLLKNAGAK